ncbi:transposase family protein [Noviherbaspirillum soli]|uniref:transposase family protein n=1 Tax=Noviherbaspirillum soli TaxID=1064518 RepID=UPI003898F136
MSVHSWQLDNGVLTIGLQCQCRNAPCPGCGVFSTCVQGWYHRQIQNLPCQGYRVRVHVDVRRFRCITSPAPQKSPAGSARAGRCGNCGACYIALLPSQSLWRPLGQKARTAMTRTRLNC